MDAYWSSRLRAIAPTLNALHARPDAECHHELMSNSLVWGDELPSEAALDPAAYSVLRCLFRYRTSLILGNSDQDLEPFWELGLELFPNWPGFQAERRDVSLADVFFRLSEGRSK